MTSTISECIFPPSIVRIYSSLVRTDGILITTRPLCTQTRHQFPLVSLSLPLLVYVGKLFSRTHLSERKWVTASWDMINVVFSARCRRSLINTSTLDVICDTSYVILSLSRQRFSNAHVPARCSRLYLRITYVT